MAQRIPLTNFGGHILVLNFSSRLLQIFHIIFACNFSRENFNNQSAEKKYYRQMYRKFKKVVLAQVTPSIFFGKIQVRSDALQFTIYISFQNTAVLRKLFDIRFLYKHSVISNVVTYLSNGFQNRDKVFSARSSVFHCTCSR